MHQLLLYTTSHCHLCEQAEHLLTTLKERYPLSWHAIEIADDDALLRRYGTRIPVIKINGCDAELGWPFTSQAIIDLMCQN